MANNGFGKNPPMSSWDEINLRQFDPRRERPVDEMAKRRFALAFRELDKYISETIGIWIHDNDMVNRNQYTMKQLLQLIQSYMWYEETTENQMRYLRDRLFDEEEYLFFLPNIRRLSAMYIRKLQDLCRCMREFQTKIMERVYPPASIRFPAPPVYPSGPFIILPPDFEGPALPPIGYQFEDQEEE